MSSIKLKQNYSSEAAPIDDYLAVRHTLLQDRAEKSTATLASFCTTAVCYICFLMGSVEKNQFFKAFTFPSPLPVHNFDLYREAILWLYCSLVVRMLQTTKIVGFKSTSENTSMDFYEQTNYSRYVFCPNMEMIV